MTKDFGKGYSERNLRGMRQFYLCFPIWQTLSAKLSWSHYCEILWVALVLAFLKHSNSARLV